MFTGAAPFPFSLMRIWEVSTNDPHPTLITTGPKNIDWTPPAWLDNGAFAAVRQPSGSMDVPPPLADLVVFRQPHPTESPTTKSLGHAPGYSEMQRLPASKDTIAYVAGTKLIA